MNLHNIHTIARYEVKLLKRSWLFRIFAVLAFVFITLILLLWQTGIVNSMEYIWPRTALTSLMPFVSVYYFSIAQSVIVIFLAGSFLKRDKKLDTAEVIYVRPMSNADYIIGKTWGIIKVFLSLNIITLLVTAFFNIAINHSPFSFFPYIFYLLTISLPSLLFVLSLSFAAMCLFKNQAITFIVMLGITGMVFFKLSNNLYGVFDFFGVNIPTIFSDVTGHANLGLFLLQRTVYLLAGVSFICFTIGLVKRLPHKPWKIIIVNVLGCIFLIAALATGRFYIMHHHHRMQVRNNYTSTFNKYEQEKKASILEHHLTVTPGNRCMESQSTIRLTNRNREDLERIVLYLNPALDIKSAHADNHPITFTRENQVVLIDTPLPSREELTLYLEYAGTIDEMICYPDINDSTYLDCSIQDAPYKFGKKYAWLEDKFTLLTPECLWYPTAIPPVNPAAPYNIKKNFTRYTLTVSHHSDKTVLSQGTAREEDGRTTFTVPYPLPGISLAIADYKKKTLTVDSVDYEILYFKGHDYFSHFFEPIQDTLPALLRDLKNDIEIVQGRDYPFRKLILAETPAQFTSYIRNWKGYTEYVQPEIVFLPERGVKLDADFTVEKNRMRRWQRHGQGTLDETEMTIRVFLNFINQIFVNENSGYRRNATINPTRISPMFHAHTGFIYSEEYPMIDIVLNTMQNITSANMPMWWSGIINNEQRANLYLEDHSFRTAISDQHIKPEIFYELLKLKSKALRNYIHTQMPPEEFNDFLKTFFHGYSFTDLPFDSFIRELKKQHGVDLRPFIHAWYTEDHSPTIFIKDVDANQVIIDEETKYQIKFKVNNPSDVNGIITVETQQGGDFRGGPRGGMMTISNGDNTPENYVIPAGEAREIKIIVDSRPASVRINTNISHNLPSSYSFSFPKIETTITDTLTGTFPISPDAFKPDPKEIIIDNENKGFHTIESNNRHKLKDLFQKTDGEKYKNFNYWWAPSKWTAIAGDYCYGESISSAVYKRKGSGNNSVQWTAKIPKNGYYEVSIWNAKQNMRRGPGRRRDQEERNQTYTIRYGNEEENITLDMEQEDSGWISWGNFYLPEGPVTITLTDKVSGRYVIADAVKFTFINE
ncbi:MAG: hypothetical protein K2L23_00270 [Odoribacter sp.]|nr:hypothetical protein [Odoribacter sp.]